MADVEILLQNGADKGLYQFFSKIQLINDLAQRVGSQYCGYLIDTKQIDSRWLFIW
jgi:imidazole glycerol phosphate synthase subunit HisF